MCKDKLVILVAHHDIEKLNASYVYKIEKGKKERVLKTNNFK